MKTIKIAFDISPLSDGNKTRGMGYYTKNLLEYLQKEIKSNPKYKNWQIDLITNSNQALSNYHLVHYPYFDLFKLTLPIKKNIPQIVTVPDLIPLQFKKHYPVGLRGFITWQIQKYKIKKSDYLITISNYSKTIINKYLNIPNDNIFVTHLAANSNFRPITNKNKLMRIKNKYKLPSEFVLYVGDINWNKNIPNLVKACIKLKYPLVIVGSAATNHQIINHPWNQDLIWLQQITKKHSNLITLTGFTDDKEIPSIYNLAKIYCQPSYSEGFGLPLVEAMQTGTPVVYSQESCLNEIMNNSGLMFDPYSIEKIAESLKRMWTYKKLRDKYSKLGIHRAKFFNWQNTAKDTLAIYEKAILNDQK